MPTSQADCMRVAQKLFILSLCTMLAAATSCGASIRKDDATPEPSPSNKAELCRIVGLDPSVDAVCNQGGVRPLLEAAFPPRVATKSEVHKALGPYLVHSRLLDDGGTLEMYAVLPGLLGPTHALFVFDPSDTLVDITIED